MTYSFLTCYIMNDQVHFIFVACGQKLNVFLCTDTVLFLSDYPEKDILYCCNNMWTLIYFKRVIIF